MFNNQYEKNGIIWFMPSYLWSDYSRNYFSRYVYEYKKMNIMEKINFKIERWEKYKRWTKDVYNVKL